MDETINLSQQMKAQAEHLKEKQKQLAERMKSRKQQVEEEHQNTMTSLEAAFAAQEEYRKGYNSVRKAFMKAESELEDMTAAFRAVTRKQREKSMQVLERMIKGSEVTMCILAFDSWEKFTKENRTARENERLQKETAEEVAALSESMKSIKGKQSEDAFRVLDRMNAATDQGLMSLTLKTWAQCCQDARQQKEEASRIHQQLKSQKEGARRTLEKSLAAALGNSLATAFNDWVIAWDEVKKVKVLQDKANAAMKRYKDQKREQSMQIVVRMSSENTCGLLEKVILVWRLERNMGAERAILAGFIERQKQRSKEVVERMTRGQDSTVIELAWRSWTTLTADNAQARENEKAAKETREEIEAIRGQMKAFQERKKDEARKVLDRMNAATETGLVAQVFGAWMKEWEDVKNNKAEAQKMQELMKNKNEEARRVLVKSFGSVIGAVLQSAFNDWLASYQEEVTLRKLKGEADRQMKAYKSQKADQSKSVVNRMSAANDSALLNQTVLIWYLGQELDKTMANYLEEKQLLKGFIDRQKAKSKSVLDRMFRSQAHTMAKMAMESWAIVTKENVQARENERASKENEEELTAVREQIKSLQSRKKSEAKNVLDRMTASSNSGLLSLTFGTWVREWQDVCDAKAEAEKMKELMKGQKEEARRVLEKSLGSAMGALVASAFNDWLASVMEEKYVKELQHSADKTMKKYKDAKREQSMTVVERMSGQRNGALLQQVVIVWRMQQELGVLQGYINRQKERSKSVLDRMTKGHDSSRVAIAWQSWKMVTNENAMARANEKAAAESRDEIASIQEQMRALKDKKKEETMGVMQRMASANDSGLLSMVLQGWKSVMDDINATAAEAQKVQDLLKSKKEESRRLLEKSLGSAMGATLASALNDWISHYLEEKKVRELKAEAEKKMKTYKEQMKGRSSVVVDRMCVQKDKQLLAQSLLVWYLGQELDKVMGNYLEEKELLKSFIHKQKEKSKTVVERMLKDSDNARISIAWQSWTVVTEENKVARANEKAQLESQSEIAAIRAQMSGLKASQRDKKDQSISVLERMAAAADRGALSVFMQIWIREYQDNKKAVEEARIMHERLKGQKSDAVRILEKNLGMAISGLVASTFNDWLSYISEQKAVRELTQEAERKLKSYKQQRKKENSVVLTRLCEHKTSALVQQVWMIWVISVAEMIRTNTLQAELCTIMQLQKSMEARMAEMV